MASLQATDEMARTILSRSVSTGVRGASTPTRKSTVSRVRRYLFAPRKAIVTARGWSDTRVLIESVSLNNLASMPTPSAQHPTILYMRDGAIAGEEWIVTEGPGNFVVIHVSVQQTVEIPSKVSAGPNKDRYWSFHFANCDTVKLKANQTNRQARGEPVVINQTAAFRIFAQFNPASRSHRHNIIEYDLIEPESIVKSAAEPGRLTEPDQPGADHPSVVWVLAHTRGSNIAGYQFPDDDCGTLTDLDGARLKQLADVMSIFAKKSHPAPMIHYSNDHLPRGGQSDGHFVDRRLLEMVVCIVRNKPSVEKPLAEARSLQSLLEKHHPQRRAYIRATLFHVRAALCKDALRSIVGNPAALTKREIYLRGSLIADLIEEQIGIGSCAALSVEGIVLRMPRLMNLESRGQWQVMAGAKEKEVGKVVAVAVARGPAPSTMDAVRKALQRR
ncbi:hypothetical protein HDU93_002852 [Gonapodya sp. JEL0774]|nr:hypothetical protein HDU93_002852 [Gonapodya sp. JEL0774]